MATRLDLHEELCMLLGSRYVYFQPPASVNMHYPCIVYSLDTSQITYANNKAYTVSNAYELTVISEDPDYDLYLSIIEHFPKCRMNRTFIADNLNHWILTLYY